MLFYNRARLFGFITRLEFTINDLTVFHILICYNLGVAYPFSIDLQFGHNLAD